MTPDCAVVEANGIGYQILIPLNLFANAPPVGESITLHTTLVVREDSQRLFGFAKKEEKELFLTFSSLSGIGPKTALGIIGHLDQIDLHTTLANKDTKPLQRIPGIGKKMAERLIFELASHAKKLNFQQKTLRSKPNSLMQDATAALLNLGYSEKKADFAIQKVLTSQEKEELELPLLITAALKHL